MSEKDEWEAYLSRFVNAYNALPELAPLLDKIAPVLFQYRIIDKPEMTYWFRIGKEDISWGMGEYQGAAVLPTVVHKTDFETMKKVNSGETDPIKATMEGTYTIEGDVTKLMACGPLIPLSAKAHANATK